MAGLVEQPAGRLNKEVRPTNVVGIFLDRAVTVRLVGTVLTEQADGWGARRHLGFDGLARCRMRLVADGVPAHNPLNL
ncbi:hypothetical protein [Streptosporangium jomthongense]|uniref:Transposase n=1 Tax=Streptosporangium jomthongense TaxID=1193683 RepID=A0ABV8FDD2_9ACTN